MNWLTQKQLQLWQELLKSKRIALKYSDTTPLLSFLLDAIPDIKRRGYIHVSWVSEDPHTLCVFVADVSGHNGDFRNCVNVKIELTEALAMCLTQAVRRHKGHHYCVECGLKVRYLVRTAGSSDCCGADISVRT